MFRAMETLFVYPLGVELLLLVNHAEDEVLF